MNAYNNNGGTYVAEVDGAGHSDLLRVLGAANLNGGEVLVSSVDGLYRFNQPYTIVSAGSVVGTYSGATSLAFITPILTYNSNLVQLTILQNLSKVGRTHNQRAVATQIDSIAHPNSLQNIFISDLVNLPLSEAQQALESLSGFQYTDDPWAADIVNRQFIRRLYDPLRSIVTTEPSCCYNPCQTCGWTAWLEAGGGNTHFRGNREAHGFNMISYEVTGGFQSTLWRNITVGVAGSYVNDSIRYSHGGSGSRTTGFGGLYGLYRPEHFYILADATYGYTSNKMHRSIHAGALHDKARSKPNISQGAFYGEIGIDFECFCLLMQPFAGIQAGRSDRHHVKEKNDSGLGLNLKKHEWSSSSARLGVHLTANKFFQCLDASLDVAWDRLLTKRKNSAHARFIDFGSEFKVDGVHFDQNGVDYAVTLATDFCDCGKIYVEFGG